MAASSPTLTRCSVCGELTRRPYYRHIYTECIPYCEVDARCFSYGFTAENAIADAQRIIREHQGKAVARARLYATALGLYEPHLNGQIVGDDVFAPGWTDYDIRAYIRGETFEPMPVGTQVIVKRIGITRARAFVPPQEGLN